MNEYMYDYERFLEDWDIWEHSFFIPLKIESKTILVHVTPKKIAKQRIFPDREIYIFEAKYKIEKKRYKERFSIIFSQLGVHGYGKSNIAKLCANLTVNHIQSDLYLYRFKPAMLEIWTDYDTGTKYSWWLATNRDICEEYYIL